jgi:hypothetical protein
VLPAAAADKIDNPGLQKDFFFLKTQIYGERLAIKR